jgi:hypothetical protein
LPKQGFLLPLDVRERGNSRKRKPDTYPFARHERGIRNAQTRKDLAFVELNGQRIYLGPYGTKVSKREFDRVVGEWLQAGRQLPRENALDEICVNELIVA